MIKLEDKQNVEAPNAAYPYGALKNDTGVNDGTPVDKEVYDDFHQFFSRMFGLSGVISNGLPDNLTNDFQYFQALEELSVSIKYRGSLSYGSNAELTSNSNNYSGNLVSFLNVKKIFEINISDVSSFPYIITSLGNASIGTEIIIRMTIANNSVIRFHINSTNLGGNPIIRKDGVSSNNTLISLPSGTDKSIRFVKFPTYWSYYDM